MRSVRRSSFSRPSSTPRRPTTPSSIGRGSMRSFMRSFLGPRFGSNPLQRGTVRKFLGKAGLLGMVDPAAKGQHARNPGSLSKKETTEFIEKAREAMKEEKPWGVQEKGEYRKRTPKRATEKALEDIAAAAIDPKAVAMQREEERTIQLHRARRRELVRQELDLPVHEKLAKEQLSRREALEKRLDEMKEAAFSKNPKTKTTPQPGAKAPTAPAAAPLKTVFPTVRPAPGQPPAPAQVPGQEPTNPHDIVPNEPQTTIPTSSNQEEQQQSELPPEDQEDEKSSDIDRNLPL